MKVEKDISDNKWEGTPDDCDQLKLSRKMEAYHQDRNHQHCLCMYNRCKKTKEEKRRKNTKQETKKEKKKNTKGQKTDVKRQKKKRKKEYEARDKGR